MKKPRRLPGRAMHLKCGHETACGRPLRIFFETEDLNAVDCFQCRMTNVYQSRRNRLVWEALFAVYARGCQEVTPGLFKQVATALGK